MLSLGAPADYGNLATIGRNAAVAHIRDRGVKVSEPQTVGPGRQAFLRDPSGNLVELNQPV